jgi:hypothetical protein
VFWHLSHVNDAKPRPGAALPILSVILLAPNSFIFVQLSSLVADPQIKPRSQYRRGLAVGFAPPAEFPNFYDTKREGGRGGARFPWGERVRGDCR